MWRVASWGARGNKKDWLLARALKTEIVLTHVRGIHVMKAFMDEERFEEGGVVVHMRKSTTEQPTKRSLISGYDSKFLSTASIETRLCLQ